MMSPAAIPPVALGLLEFTKDYNIRHDALLAATGGRFNFFNIVKVGHLEVKTHSPILCELLNPRGSHGQGALFLKLFVEQLGIENFDPESASAHLEYYAGPKTEDSGGRIDILLVDSKARRISIENKIHAGDQENQTQRYRNFDLAGSLLYLTLEGRKPDNAEKVSGLRCIAYRTEILTWLRSCREAVDGIHNLRESLTQYIQLIEELTGQTTNSIMNKELIDTLIKDAETLRAFQTLYEAKDAVNWFLIEQLDLQLNAVAKDVHVTSIGSLHDLWRRHGGFKFSTPGLTDRNLQICFAFDGAGYRDFYFGFGALNVTIPCVAMSGLQDAFEAKFPKEEPNDEWPAWAWAKEYQNLGAGIYEEIRSGAFAENIREKLSVLVMIANQFCPNPPPNL